MSAQRTGRGARPIADRDRSLDIAKGIAISVVVLGHLTPVGFLPGAASHLVGQLSSLIINAPYRWLFKAAVPAFYLVSSVIYLRRWDGSTAFLRRRLKVTGLLLGIWMLAQYACLSVLTGRLAPITLSDVLEGGPTPFGGPMYYFFVDLLLLYFVMEGVCRLRVRVGERAATRASVLVVVGFGLTFFALPFLGIAAVPYWSAWPFVCYPFLAVVVEAAGPGDRGLAAACAAVFVAGMAADVGWRMAGVDTNPFGYARLVALGGSVLVVFVAGVLDAGTSAISSRLSALGRLSLGMYVLHPFVILLLRGAMPVRAVAWAGGTLTFRLEYAAAGFAMTLALVLAMAGSPLRMLVASGPAGPGRPI